MTWVFVAFLEPIFHAFANILDSNLTNRFFKNAWLLTLFIALAVIIFLPIVWIIEPPKLFPLHLLPFFLVVAAIELFYSYPYFKALQSDDTSVAISLFALGKILVPILAFIFVGELLKPAQYFGFMLIIVSSSALTFNRATLRLNKSFFYMLLSSSLLAVEVVVYKIIFSQVSWGTGYVWTMGISAIMALISLLMLLPNKNTKPELSSLKKHYPIVLLVGCVSFLGGIGFSYAIFAVTATIARSIDSFQPFFVLLYAVAFKKFFPMAFKEEINFQSLIKKVLLFIATVVGVILTVK
jgi:drug/metabolite transporter (DMT)-like permease